MLYNLQAAVSSFEYVLSFGSMVFVVVVPILTMRTIAEERKQKTDQLLYSLPISTTEVIVGKYLALVLVYMIPLCLISLSSLIGEREAISIRSKSLNYNYLTSGMWTSATAMCIW